ncbi:MAG TPA: AI-2E family transporter [Acidimicrobiales bacterium]|nr:AI-2E family transporter [Acidimicrobiales bacterium]
MSPDAAASERPVPWRTIFAVIGSVVLTIALYKVVLQVSRILIWMLIAAFFAVVLSPPIDFLERRCRIRRGIGTLLVFFVGFGALSAIVYAFVTPIVKQSQEFADNFPRYVEDAKAGRGPMGGLVKRYNLDQRIEDRQDDIKNALNQLGSNSLSIVRGVGNALTATLTIVVLTILMLLSGPKMLQGGLGALSPPNRERVRLVSADAAKAVTGYVAGNLLISVIAGIASFTFFFFADIPFRGVLALWVAFADLIPLVGATLGAIPAVGVAFLHSTGTGIATVVFFILYQQFENHVLQVTIMSRTVNLNPLVVLVSVLIGVELSGLVGALLAIPAAGVVKVVARDLYDTRRGQFKEEPTVGAEEVPIAEIMDEEEAAEKDGAAKDADTADGAVKDAGPEREPVV